MNPDFLHVLLHAVVGIPILGFLASILIPRRYEGALSKTAFTAFGLSFVGTLALVVLWMIQGTPILDIKDWVLFQTHGYEYFIDFYLDWSSAVFALVGSFLAFMVAVYSRVYLHREPGYKRFFNTIHLLFIGYVAIVFAGNLETLFIGWEILGISSFQLIAFYRDRYLPVRNAVKVYSIYRLGDVGLILAMWASHHLFAENITFFKLGNAQLVSEHLQGHSMEGIFIALMLLLAAAVKSAQLPFSSWLPRAMEGPTPSSAIFYGSLSVHLGVFLLLRTYHFWENQMVVRVVFGLVGGVTFMVASAIGRVQSTIKSQIAYSSIAQIGVMFVELALGLHWLALLHFASNAFLRTYQLLVSPSAVTYLIREQFYNYVPRSKTVEDSLPKRIMYSLYVWSLKEWNLDLLLYRIYRAPFKWMGRRLEFLGNKGLLAFVLTTLAIGMTLLSFQDVLPEELREYLPPVFAFVGLLLVLRSYVERKHAWLGFALVLANHAWLALAISFNERFDLSDIVLYLSGIVVAGALGLTCLAILKRLEKDVDLDRHQGHLYEHGMLGLVFFISCLGVVGFPITPTFIGEDLIFSHIHEDQIFLAAFSALSLIFDGLAIIRIYAKVFMGNHIKTYHEVAYRSS